MNLLGISVPFCTLQRWKEIFVFPDEPLFFTETLLDLARDLNPQPRTPRGNLNFADAYQTYHVGSQASHVACCPPDTIRFHPHHDSIMQLQMELGRGQIYPLEAVLQVFGTLPAVLKPDLFETNTGPHVALRHDAWHALTAEDQERWLAAQIEQDREPCLSSALSEDLWKTIELHCGPQVRRLAGQFAAESGPNCLATALAPLLADEEKFLSIQNTWLHPEPFLTGLHEQGFLLTETDLAAPQNFSVLVLLDQKGNLQHACLHLTRGLVLNKDAQGWFAPRQIRTLESVLKPWMQPGWTVHTYAQKNPA
ncbi:hypothetical protein [Deinococcus roseus]|uniref:Uncharacterized protein n=1 Tax=Deinococcus roseus TaxID=392414 RepID=A0ABQ2CYS7_9DEIO|nr:hypothetical protein [Deinococcus roseus]GGJ33715.1 hypothetical protein GCM10008938_19980 [Deinococcus roseus]